MLYVPKILLSLTTFYFFKTFKLFKETFDYLKTDRITLCIHMSFHLTSHQDDIRPDVKA